MMNCQFTIEGHYEDGTERLRAWCGPVVLSFEIGEHGALIYDPKTSNIKTIWVHYERVKAEAQRWFARKYLDPMDTCPN